MEPDNELRLVDALERIATSLERLTMSSREVMEQTDPGLLGKINIPVVVRQAATELNVIGL